MNQLQQIILATYKEFRKICLDNDLRFFAYAGTALGAVRHKGFIPWDDDMDLTMPVDDLGALAAIVKKRTNKNFDVWVGVDQTVSETTIVRFYDKRTTFTPHDLIGCPESFLGVFIDIFPMIGAPAHKTDQLAFSKELYGILESLWLNKLYLTDGGKPTIAALTTRYKQMIKQYDYNKTESVVLVDRIFMQEHSDVIFKRKWFDDYLEMPFEDTTIPVSAEFDRQLTRHYGADYMKIPKNQEQHHLGYALIDFTRSYQVYQALLTSKIGKNYVGDVKQLIDNLNLEKQDLLSRIPPLEERIALERDKVAQYRNGQISRREALRILARSIKQQLKA